MNATPAAPQVNTNPALDAGRLLAIANNGTPTHTDREVMTAIVGRYADILGDALYTATLRQIAIMISRLN